MIDRTRVSVQVAQAIQETISSMGLKSGDKLPSQSALSRRMNVSVPTLREGLERLAMVGAVNMVHGVGTIVSTPSSNDISSVLEPLFFGRNDNVDDLKELLCALALPIAESRILTTGTALDESGQLSSWSQVVQTADDADQLVIGLTRYLKTLSYPNANNTITSLADSVHELILFRARDNGILAENIKKIKHVTRLLTFHIELKNLEGFKDDFSKYASLITSNRAHNQKFIRIGTGSARGSFDRLGSRLLHYLPETKKLLFRCIPTGGGIENVDISNIGRVDFSITQLEVARQAWDGSGIFTARRSNLRAVCRLSPLYLWAIVRKDSSIYTIADLNRARIAVGAVGGNTSTLTRRVLEESGLPPAEYESFQLSFLNALHAFRAGKVDAMFYLNQAPFVALDELNLSMKVRLLPVNPPSNKTWARKVVQWGADKNTEAGHVPTIAVETLLITHDQVRNDIVRFMFSSVFDFLKDEQGVSDVKDLVSQLPLPLHDGVPSQLDQQKIDVTGG